MDRAEEEHNACCMLANALIAHTGARKLAAEKAAKRIATAPDAKHKQFWTKVHHILLSGQPIPNHRGHFEDIPSRHAMNYVRISNFAAGGAVGDKSTKTQANYRPGNTEHHCSICTMWIAPKGNDHHGRCTAVEGDIAPTALCDLFERKEKRRAAGGGVEHDNGLHYRFTKGIATR